MAVLDIRQRTGWLFLVLTIGHVLLISTQATTERGVPVLEEAAVGAFAELQRVASSAVTMARSGWADYVDLVGVRRENGQLRQEIAALRIAVQQERATAEQSRALRALLDMKTDTRLPTTGAAVIAGEANPEFRTISIDKGTADGLRPDMAVLAPAGVVGRVVLPATRAAKVQLLIDRDAAAGAIVERSRVQGVIVGTGSDRFRLDHVPSAADQQVGDRVVTSGIEGIYPKGFLIGQIESVARQSGEYTAVEVRPAVDFSALEFVLVVLTPPAGEGP
jgi:rod shape-determining protein MreC